MTPETPRSSWTPPRTLGGASFCGSVLDYGPDSAKKLAIGTPVVAVPLIRHGREIHAIGLSASAPGAYAEHVVVEESLMFELPNGLSPQGVATIVASDYSSARRDLAHACGATVVVDPSEGSPYDATGDAGHVRTIPEAALGGVGLVEKLQRRLIPWHYVWRVGEKLGAKPKRPVIFEFVGAPGVIDSIITSAPLYSRVVVGVCMGTDAIRPVMAINKEIDLRFVVGYTPLEFRDTLHMLANGKVDASAIVTGTVGLAGVETAFDALHDPEQHAKIVIDPTSPATAPTCPIT